MPNLLASTNLFGKAGADEYVSQRGVPDDIATRLKLILDETGLSARQLSAKIGSSHSAIEAIVNRRSKNPEASRLERIAHVTGYNLAWLLTGKGDTKSRKQTVPAERYAAMAAVREMGRAQGFDEEFVAKWEVDLDADEQPDADYLWTLMKAAYARARRKVEAKGNPAADLDEQPARAKTRRARG
jgi:transcriptional regulator with XRE-family HTH domain